MRILHYSLGFPPYRSGGLTKYATDLMKYQAIQGNDVTLLWPGRIRILNKSTKIRKQKKYFKIKSYEIINPLDIPLLNGIIDEKNYIKSCNKIVYEEFLKTIKPDVIHVHTLMGIHKEFFEVAKELNIKLIYTSHDYFGICPKVNLLFNGKPCNNINFEKCKKCNSTAFNRKQIVLLQSKLYRKLKGNKVLKLIKNKYKDSNKEVYDYNINNCDYKKLSEYYNWIFNSIDVFHFNSVNTYKIYSEHIKINEFRIINITHADISDKRQIKKFEGNLKITYLGATEEYKGYKLVRDVLDDLYYNGNKKFELNVYSYINDRIEYINVNDRYTYDQLSIIFNNSDLLVAPSLCYETFGFVVLEALSYGVPVLISDNVGAKDLIINELTGTIIKPNFQELKSKILQYYNDRSILEKQNINILNYDFDFDFFNHVNKISKDCYE